MLLEKVNINQVSRAGRATRPAVNLKRAVPERIVIREPGHQAERVDGLRVVHRQRISEKVHVSSLELPHVGMVSTKEAEPIAAQCSSVHTSGAVTAALNFAYRTRKASSAG